jgi:DNA-binding MarR family transcriptional regulator
MRNSNDRADAPATQFRQLADEQLAAWSGFLRGHAQIVRALDAELEQEHGLPLTSYDVLIQLSLVADRRLRMSELADAIVLSRSGLTRLVDRLERGGLVERERGEADPRQVYARLTDRGFQVVAEATPTHIAGIKERFLERLSKEQTKQLAAIWRAMLGPQVEREVLEAIHRTGLDTTRKEKS